MTDALARAIRAQIQAADPEACAFVTANAGSGKTKVLVDRVARLLLQGVAPNSILCVTYTKAAASEMQNRLFEALGAWSIADDADLVRHLGELEGRALGLGPAQAAQKLAQARRLFARALETPGGLKIETVHAFCQRILSRFPLEAGLVPGFEVSEERDQAKLLDRAWQYMLWLAMAAEERARGSDPQGISAEAGLIATLFDQLHEWSSPDKIQLLMHEWARLPLEPQTLRQTLCARFGVDPDEDLNALENAILADAPLLDLKQAAHLLGLSTKVTDQKTAEKLADILDAGPGDSDARKNYLEVFYTGTDNPRKDPVTKAMRQASPIIARIFGAEPGSAGTEFRRIDDLRRTHRALELAQRSAVLCVCARFFADQYRIAKQQAARLDFDDLIARMRALLRDPGIAPWILFKLDGGISHVLVDEAQDTAPAQWDVLETLWAEFFAAESQRTVFAVGDEKQSIYSFQGARPALFLEQSQKLSTACSFVDRKFTAPALVLSFRSGSEILSFVDAVMNLRGQKAAEPAGASSGAALASPPQSEDIIRHEARRHDQPARVELWPATNQPLKPELNPWEAPVDQPTEDSSRAQLADWVGRECRRILDDGDAVWYEKRDEAGKRLWAQRPAQAQDILILVQGRGPLFDLILRALKRHNVPVAGADRLVLSESLAVLDLLALARFALDPSDDLALAEALKGPLIGLTDDDSDLFPLTDERDPDESLWANLQRRQEPRFVVARQILEAIIARAHATPFAFFAYALERLYKEADGEPSQSGYQRFEQRLGAEAREPIDSFLTRAQSFPADNPASLLLFVTRFMEEKEKIKRELSAPKSEARIMTVHGAKGLEAPIVILPDTNPKPKSRIAWLDLDPGHEDGALPVWCEAASPFDPDAIVRARQAQLAEQAAEAKRLFYVAMTRARDRLVLCGAKLGQAPGSLAPQSWYVQAELAMHELSAQGLAQEFAPDPASQARGATGGAGEDSPPISATGYSMGPMPERLTRASDVESASPVPDWASRALPMPPRSVNFVAPSRLFDAGHEPAIHSPLLSLDPHRFARGRWTHVLLQALPNVEADAQRRVAAQLLARAPGLSAAIRTEIVNEVMQILHHPQLSAAFGANSRAEVGIIGTAQSLPRGLVVNGRVDRLAILPDRVLLIDYKTNRPPPFDPENVAKSYLTQMAVYRAILQEKYPDKVVEAVLIWTDGPRIMELPSHILDQALNCVSRH